MGLRLSKEIAWAGFETRVPEDWEVSRHGISPRRGSLVLVDRRRQRFELTWQHCEKKPDLGHSSEDLRARFRREGASSDELPRLKSVPGWLGFWRRIDSLTVLAYALRWQRESGRIFQATIVARDDEHVDNGCFVAEILRSCLDNLGERKAIHWKAFGIDCISPPGWALDSTRMYSMDVKLQFRNPDNKQGVECAVHRMGMAGTWFNGDAESFVRSKEPKLDFRFDSMDYNGHRAMTAVARTLNRLFHRITGKRLIRRELIWQCEPANSLFRVTTVCNPGENLLPQDLAAQCTHNRTGD